MKLRNKKTGEIEVFDCVGALCFNQDKSKTIKRISAFSSLAELNEEWEDYTPQEPLINDKDVRNIIRYIASTYGSDQVYVTNFGMGDIKIKFSFENAGSTYLCFSLNTGIHVPDGLYTITELCGEEE